MSLSLQCSMRAPCSSARALAPSLRLSRACARRQLAVRAQADGSEEEKRKIAALEESLKQQGLDRQRAQQVLQAWREAAGGGDGKEVTPEDLRKVLVKQGSKFSILVVIQVFLDLGAAYGAFYAGNFLGEGVEQYGVLAVGLQAIAYFLSGYYAIGAFFDLFKLGMLVTATYQFNVNSAAFLAAVQDLAGRGPTGLGTVDKAMEAVNTVKVVAALNKMADLLKEKQGGEAAAPDVLRDLAVYLTLEKAQRLYGFDAARYGITDAQAAAIATVFTAYDADDNGVLSLDEFQRLCAQYAPELSAAEIKAGLQLLDTNQDGQIQLGEFVDWWLKKVSPPAAA
ncbi:calcium sensor EFh [Micractinium conductrix]|uniref:Calcium sensor EFh n=1 Tax=Micractinium conductrix TaxID=554055 RepID=A0A2P6VN85_9CHLO|nr:calcium sensor EFh [Micractinium conductrix]|eukprot:PSC75550.1 calcium sensor EFh [Micractinium conductrix]